MLLWLRLLLQACQWWVRTLPRVSSIRTRERLRQPLLLLPPPHLSLLLRPCWPLLMLKPLTLTILKRLQPPVVLLSELLQLLPVRTLITGVLLQPLLILARFAPPLGTLHRLARVPEPSKPLLTLLMSLLRLVCCMLELVVLPALHKAALEALRKLALETGMLFPGVGKLANSSPPLGIRQSLAGVAAYLGQHHQLSVHSLSLARLLRDGQFGTAQLQRGRRVSRGHVLGGCSMPFGAVPGGLSALLPHAFAQQCGSGNCGAAADHRLHQLSRFVIHDETFSRLTIASGAECKWSGG